MSDRAIKEAVQHLANTHLRDDVHMAAATVTSVNVAERTCACTPISGGAVTDFANVMLMPEVDDGWLLVPAIDSTVIIMWSAKNVPYIAMTAGIDKALLVTLNGIQLQDGTLGGLVKLLPLVDKLNKLESDLNTIKNVFSSWTPVPNDGGAALKAAAASWAGNTITETVRGDLENTAITQGNPPA